MSAPAVSQSDAWRGLVHACLYECALPAFARTDSAVQREGRAAVARSLVEQWSALAVRASLSEAPAP